jgi:hypothetical protein
LSRRSQRPIEGSKVRSIAKTIDLTERTMASF